MKGKRAIAYQLAEDAGLIDSKGNLTREYVNLIERVTGKNRMADMTLEEADRFLKALASLPKAPKKPSFIMMELPKLPIWVFIITAIIISMFFMIDWLDGTEKYVGKEIIGYHQVYGFGGLRTVADYRSIYSDITWATTTSIIIGAVSIYFTGIWTIFRLAKHQSRNMVSWVTASIVFTPILAIIAYLLTWPKNQPFKAEENEESAKKT